MGLRAFTRMLTVVRVVFARGRPRGWWDRPGSGCTGRAVRVVDMDIVSQEGSGRAADAGRFCGSAVRCIVQEPAVRLAP